MNKVAVVCDICLVGGGHSHALLLRRWAMQPLPGVRLTLISSTAMTPYSGMLPGLIAGHYSVDDIHIDLYKLCSWAGVRFIEQTVVSLDLDARQVMFDDRPPLAFDVLSLDTGSTPDLSIEGSREHVTPVKPVHSFYARWQQLQSRLSEPGSNAIKVGVVGAGAGGFELVTAMRHVLPSSHASIHWFLRGDNALSRRTHHVGELALQAARRKGVEIVTHFDVVRVERGRLIAADRREFFLDEILWCTAATGPAWSSAAGLAVDSRGFILTAATLQSLSHDFVFASGDVGTQYHTPSAKAGVFAVRQAPFLYENLRRYILNMPLKAYRPQKNYLSLMATGGKRAIASRGRLAVEADWIWRWKDDIDQRFMRKFDELPPLRMNQTLNRLPNALRARLWDSTADDKARDAGFSNSSPDLLAMQCRGCGSKVGESVLERVLAKVHKSLHTNEYRTQRGHVNAIQQASIQGQSARCTQTEARFTEDSFNAAVNLSPAGDTAILDLHSTMLVQSIDHINAIIDDPYLLGRLSALHALSDVVTVDASAHSAQLIVAVPHASRTIMERDLTQLMLGLAQALQEEQCLLAGGHTVAAEELSIGVVVNATLNKPRQNPQLASSTLSPGDVLILTQPLGIGTLFAGLMQGQGSGLGLHISRAVEYMLMSNRPAAEILRTYGANFMTDVTGFGLLGHLHRLMRGLGQGATLSKDAIPLIPGALKLALQGVRSSLWRENRHVLKAISIDPMMPEHWLAILCDPQTGGGLLAIVPQAECQACLQSLQQAGYRQSSVVGVVTESDTITLS